VKVILDHAHTGIAGDGLIAVYPLDYMIKVRTKEKLGKNE
jgi:nitrogen regulatory protein PII